MNNGTDDKARIGFLLSDNMLATSAALPMEMLLAADTALGPPSTRHSHTGLSVHTLSWNGAATRTRCGLRWQPDMSLNDGGLFDIVYVPGLWRNPRPVVRRHPEVLDWLRHQYQNGALISAVGTGCCFPAEAGLLDGKPATTHWHYFDQFQRDYPQAQLKRQYFITQAGNLYCAASVNSLADLTVHFIQRLFGKAIASHVERHFSHEIRRPYESIGYSEKVRQHPDEDIVQAQHWLQDNYQRDIAMVAVAERFGMSLRSFNRRFKTATGLTPVHYLQEIRINNARDLLQTSNLTIHEVAEKVGYQDTGYFTALFKRQLATTPSDYRATVRAKLFTADMLAPRQSDNLRLPD